MIRVGLVQLSSGEEPAANLPVTDALVREAAEQGAKLVVTPEVTNMVSADKARMRALATAEEQDVTLAGLRRTAADCGLWLVIGSLVVRSGEAQMANRSFLIGPDGAIHARYDKIHMFDVELGDGESYRESALFVPGEAAVLAKTPLAAIGLTICYDVRFGHLYRDLARAGAEIVTVPAAFTVPTGKAHWQVLLRARAIETGAFVLAAAQTGRHVSASGRARETWGHSMAVSPRGEVLAEAEREPGVILADLDLGEVARARARIPALGHDRAYDGPD